MKKILSICFLWAFSFALWGQSKGGYGGDFNPTNPGNPQEPSVTVKYDFKVTAGKGGYVSHYPSEAKFTKDTQIQLNANPNAGYRFKCWMEDNKVISNSEWHYYTMPAKDVEIKAVFAFEPDVPGNPEVIPLDYRVTAEASPSRGGNVDYDRNEVRVGSGTYVNAWSQNGYKFKGWMLDGKMVSTDSYYYFEMPSRNLHFTAMFEFDPDAPSNPSTNPNGETTYQVKYTIDGQVCYTEQLPAGATITTIAEPIKKGHTFSGWNNVPALMPASDVVISGTFTANVHHVTYKIDGTVVHEEDVAYGTALTPPTKFNKEGYTLVWESLPTTMPDNDVETNGSYSINSYKLTYIVDGNVYKTVDVVYQSAITPLENPTKEGHTFSGWSEIPETMPAYDVTVAGSFSVNSYKITYMVDSELYKEVTCNYGTTITAEAAPIKVGHTFSGWDGLPKTMPANDITVTGSFTINTYKLIYKVDGVEYKSYDVVYATAITPEAAPTKEGHTFSGWSEIPETMPANNVTVTGSFSVNSYVLTYMVDGEVYATSTYTYGSYINYMDTPYKEGYTFNGWEGLPEYMPATDVTVNASYSVNSYMVYYYVDGMVYHSESVAYGSTITPPESPSREGCVFSGWEGLPETMPAWDVYVYGYYNMQYYTVTYMVEGEVYATSTYTYGSYINYMDAPYRDGYVFCGWEGLPMYMPNCDITVYAKYSVYSPNSHMVTYYVDGMVYHTEYVTSGTLISLPEAPVKDGYIFGGWGDYPIVMPDYDVYIYGKFYIKDSYADYPYFFTVGEADGTVSNVVDGRFEFTSPEYKAESPITKLRFKFLESYNENGRDCLDSGLFPQVAIAEFYLYDGEGNLVELTVDNFYTNAQETIEGPMEYICDKDKNSFWHSAWTFNIGAYHYLEVTIPDGLNLTEFSFGWTSRYTSQVVPKTVEVSGLTDSISYIPSVYTMTYVLNGEVYRSISYTEGSTIEPLEMPMREGYSFSGWEGMPTVMPSNDVTVYGTYNVNYYNITYMVDAMTYYTDAYMYGAEIKLPESPTKEGYTFNGWEGIHTTMPAYDIVVNAMFSANYYWVTFMADGMVWCADYLMYGSVINIPEAPIKEGYTFNGWGEVSGTVPAYDVTYEACYTVNTYNVYYYLGDMLVYMVEVAYGDMMPDVPSLDGYPFIEWMGEMYDSMPAHDVVYIANVGGGIEQSATDSSQMVIYDLSGRKLSVSDLRELTKGVYIVNGKRVLVP